MNRSEEQTNGAPNENCDVTVVSAENAPDRERPETTKISPMSAVDYKWRSPLRVFDNSMRDMIPLASPGSAERAAPYIGGRRRLCWPAAAAAARGSAILLSTAAGRATRRGRDDNKLVAPERVQIKKAQNEAKLGVI
jgi:hypothetical protein